MKRLLLSVAATVLLVPAGAAGQADPSITRPFAPTATGTIVTSRLLLDVQRLPTGHRGTASLVVKPTKGGTLAKGTIYESGGSVDVRFVFEVGARAADGSRAILGGGKVVGGTIAYPRARGSFVLIGRRSAEGVDAIRLEGSIRQDIPALGSGRGQ